MGFFLTISGVFHLKKNSIFERHLNKSIFMHHFQIEYKKLKSYKFIALDRRTAPCEKMARIFTLTQIICIIPEIPSFDLWPVAGVNSFQPRVSNLHEFGLIDQEYPGGQPNKETFPIFSFKVEIAMKHQN